MLKDYQKLLIAHNMSNLKYIDCTSLFNTDPYTIKYCIMINPSNYQEINDKYLTLPEETFLFPFITERINSSKITKSNYIIVPIDLREFDIKIDIDEWCNTMVRQFLTDPNLPRTSLERIL